MTIITQDGIIVNYKHVKTISMFDGEGDNGEKLSFISALMSDSSELYLAAYDSEEAMENEYNRLIKGIRSDVPLFIFDDEEVSNKPESVKEITEEIPRYKNRFIEKR